MSETGQTERRIADAIAGAAATPLAKDVAAKTRAHLLDTLAAMVSGRALPAGRRAAGYVAERGAPGSATVAAADLRLRAEDAAFANAMAAHADETDDSHLGGRFHPGCAVVPAALAVAEERDADGAALLRAVALGYDMGARFTKALGMTSPRSWTHSTHCLGANFGAAAAAGALAGLDRDQCRWLLAYAVQQASGVPIWQRDGDHVQKAYDFGGRAARDGVFAAGFVASGATGVEDAVTGAAGYLRGFAEAARPEALLEGIDARAEILGASIKKWSVGSPIQAALDSLEHLITEHGVSAEGAARLTVVLPDDRISIVDDRDMPDVCVQHCLAVLLIDGALPFAAAHDKARMSDPAVRALRRRIVAVPSAELTEARPARQAIVAIETTDGRRLERRTRAVLGTPDNPMSYEQVAEKARDLITPALGRDRAEALIALIGGLDASVSSRRIGR